MKVDYIIVGLGIAGISFCKQLLDNNKSFIVITDTLAGATEQSGGVFNPIVLRRFTAPEDSIQYTDYAISLYKDLQKRISEEYLYPSQEVLRIFNSIEEQNNWFAASDKRHLKPFMTPSVEENKYPYVLAKYGYGKVLQSFRIDPITFVRGFRRYLINQNTLYQEAFEYSSLKYLKVSNSWKYKSITAKHILFAEGIQMLQNPFVPSALLRPNKGEFIIIRSPELKLDKMLKGGVYIIPLGKDVYKVGATYDLEDSSHKATVAARKEIEKNLQKMISCNYQVIDQVVGIRPTTRDRQPILGRLQADMYVFNGLGTRGFTRGPSYSKILYDFIENNTAIPKEMNVQRFIS